jgi:hypothetical protein
MAEFQYNNHVHSAMQTIPFMVNHRRLPRMGFELHEASKVEAVNDFVMQMKGALEEAHVALTKAKDDMVQYYNHQPTPAPHYNISNCVFLDVSDLHIS